MTGIALRPATPADSEFCFQLHEAAMGGYVTAIWARNSRSCPEVQSSGVV